MDKIFRRTKLFGGQNFRQPVRFLAVLSAEILSDKKGMLRMFWWKSHPSRQGNFSIKDGSKFMIWGIRARTNDRAWRLFSTNKRGEVFSDHFSPKTRPYQGSKTWKTTPLDMMTFWFFGVTEIFEGPPIFYIFYKHLGSKYKHNNIPELFTFLTRVGNIPRIYSLYSLYIPSPGQKRKQLWNVIIPQVHLWWNQLSIYRNLISL